MANTYPEARAELRARRKANKLTLEALGKACGKSTSLVSEWESGTRTPTFSDALALERELTTPTVEAWGYDRETARRPKVDVADDLAPTGS